MFMATLIKNKRIAPDSWQQLRPAAEGGLPALPVTGDWIVPLAIWNEQRAQLVQRSGKNGVLLENTDDPRALAADWRAGIVPAAGKGGAAEAPHGTAPAPAGSTETLTRAGVANGAGGALADD